MDDLKYEQAFSTISFAGESKSEAMAAIECARNGDFEAAEQHLKSARDLMLSAHHLQTEMITQQARGESVEVNIILVHSQDHLTMAQMMMDVAGEFISLYAEIGKLKGAN